MELMRAFDSNEEKHRVVGKADDCVEMIEGLEKDRPVFGIDLGTTVNNVIIFFTLIISASLSPPVFNHDINLKCFIPEFISEI